MKKLNLKQPKYIFPLVILLPIVFLAYEISKFTDSSDEPQKGVVTDNINMSLPDARNEGVGNKMEEMNKHFSEDGAYTAIGALGDDKELPTVRCPAIRRVNSTTLMPRMPSV